MHFSKAASDSTSVDVELSNDEPRMAVEQTLPGAFNLNKTQNDTVLSANGTPDRVVPSVKTPAVDLPKEQRRNSRSQCTDSDALKHQVSQQRSRTLSRRRDSLASSQQSNATSRNSSPNSVNS